METRNQYFGSQMLKSSTAAATLSLTALIMVFSVAILVPEPSLGLERADRRLPSLELPEHRLGSQPKISPEPHTAKEPVFVAGRQGSIETLARYRAVQNDLRSNSASF